MDALAGCELHDEEPDLRCVVCQKLLDEYRKPPAERPWWWLHGADALRR